MRFCFAIALSLFSLLSSAAFADKAVHLKTTRWDEPKHSWFGGFSGLELTENGQAFVAITDRGRFVKGRFVRENGTIKDIKLTQTMPLLGTDGKPANSRDAEGLALRKDGRIYISFEGHHRVWVYLKPGNSAAWLPRADAFKKFPANAGLEALAVDTKNRLYAVAEQVRGNAIPVYRFGQKQWGVIAKLPAEGLFKPVGADFGPDGKFYLLERHFSGIGFRTRLRRFDLSGSGKPETLIETATGTYDNLEGLSVWRDDDGRTRLTMISDDNKNMFQTTQFVEYYLTE